MHPVVSCIHSHERTHTHEYKEKMSENNKYRIKAYRTPNTQFIEHLPVGARTRPPPTVNKICISSAYDISEHSTDKPFSSHTQLHLQNMLAKLCELVETSMLESCVRPYRSNIFTKIQSPFIATYYCCCVAMEAWIFNAYSGVFICTHCCFAVANANKPHNKTYNQIIPHIYFFTTEWC